MLTIQEFNALGLDGMKRCSECGEIKPLEQFSTNPANKKHGRRSICRPCDSEKKRKKRNDPKTYETYRARSVQLQRQIRDRQRTKSRPGFIYLIQCDRFCKIGKSVDAERRLKEISTILPFEVKLLHQIETNNVVLAERQLHDKFSDCRYKGEWFELSPHELSWLLSVPTLNFLE